MRTLSKTLTYGTMHFVVAVAVAYALTGDWRIAFGIGTIEPLVQTLAYTLHERVWSRVPSRTKGGKDDEAATYGPHKCIPV